jgi:hypothetical protein
MDTVSTTTIVSFTSEQVMLLMSVIVGLASSIMVSLTLLTHRNRSVLEKIASGWSKSSLPIVEIPTIWRTQIGLKLE